MKPFKVLILATALAAVVGLVPWLMPSGSSTSLDAAGLLASGRLLVAWGVVFAGGLLTSLTPCVYPLIPITVGVFGARHATSRGKALLLTSTYVFGMGAVFAGLGVAAALSGRAFGSVLGSPAVAIGLAVFLTALAASMFGAFELALPSSVSTRLSTVGGGGYVGALLMGGVSGFLAAPCTGPVLSAVLAFVARSQSPILGGALLFTYALGIGVPFMLIGAFALRLPKGGAWMEWVKSLFGISLLALALGYLLDAFPMLRQLPVREGVALSVVAAALALLGGLLGAVHRSFSENLAGRLMKGVGVGAVVLAVALQLSARPGVDRSSVRWDLSFDGRTSASTEPFDELLARAKRQGRPVMIDFSAQWCAACKELDRKTYVDSSVVDEARRFVNIRVDGTQSSEALDALYERYGVEGLPTIVFIDAEGGVRLEPRVKGFIEAKTMLAHLKGFPALEGALCAADDECPFGQVCGAVQGTSPARCAMGCRHDEQCPHATSCRKVACRTSEPCLKQCG